MIFFISPYRQLLQDMDINSLQFLDNLVPFLHSMYYLGRLPFHFQTNWAAREIHCRVRKNSKQYIFFTFSTVFISLVLVKMCVSLANIIVAPEIPHANSTADANRY